MFALRLTVLRIANVGKKETPESHAFRAMIRTSRYRSTLRRMICGVCSVTSLPALRKVRFINAQPARWASNYV
jgi:hypothetical protein